MDELLNQTIKVRQIYENSNIEITDNVEVDNRLPVSSRGVYNALQNIEEQIDSDFTKHNELAYINGQSLLNNGQNIVINSIQVDNQLNSNSSNPVANSVINQALLTQSNRIDQCMNQLSAEMLSIDSTELKEVLQNTRQASNLTNITQIIQTTPENFKISLNNNTIIYNLVKREINLNNYDQFDTILWYHSAEPEVSNTIYLDTDLLLTPTLEFKCQWNSPYGEVYGVKTINIPNSTIEISKNALNSLVSNGQSNGRFSGLTYSIMFYKPNRIKVLESGFENYKIYTLTYANETYSNQRDKTTTLIYSFQSGPYSGEYISFVETKTVVNSSEEYTHQVISTEYQTPTINGQSLDTITSITYDSTISGLSTNAPQTGVIKTYIDNAISALEARVAQLENNTVK